MITATDVAAMCRDMRESEPCLSKWLKNSDGRIYRFRNWPQAARTAAEKRRSFLGWFGWMVSAWRRQSA